MWEKGQFHTVAKFWLSIAPDLKAVTATIAKSGTKMYSDSSVIALHSLKFSHPAHFGMGVSIVSMARCQKWAVVCSTLELHHCRQEIIMHNCSFWHWISLVEGLRCLWLLVPLSGDSLKKCQKFVFRAKFTLFSDPITGSCQTLDNFSLVVTIQMLCLDASIERLLHMCRLVIT